MTSTVFGVPDVVTELLTAGFAGLKSACELGFALHDLGFFLNKANERPA
jgi:hypothetical protein